MGFALMALMIHITQLGKDSIKMTFYSIKFGVSKGRDTYGYSIVTLTNTDTGEKFRCMGGGYDMAGTVLGDALEKDFQDLIYKKRNRAHAKVKNKKYIHNKKDKSLYGMTYRIDDKRVTLDGACGVGSMERIAEECGVKLESLYDRSKRNPTLIGYNIDC